MLAQLGTLKKMHVLRQLSLLCDLEEPIGLQPARCSGAYSIRNLKASHSLYDLWR